ncbi:MAG: NB-ARC domain-containing protein [Phycisphaerae bacterium]|nr:NB-ARC domain-containing protein [Phycisphaerae bacterium]
MRAMSQSVFISYAREDDEPFVKRLHKDLTRAGFEVWWDRASLRTRRLPFRQEIRDAICSHDRLILVVGPKAAVSESVRQEWQWALELDKPIIPILRKGDYTHLPGKLSSLQCDDFRDNAQYRVQLAKLVENLRRPEPPLAMLFGVPSLPPHFLARPDLLRQVKDALLADLKKPVVITGADARVGMHGMGGIGKSVLAVAIARDREVRRSYPDGIIWLTVGQQPDLVRLQHDVARHFGNKEHFDSEPQGQGVLRRLLTQKAVLLVLDDVWSASDTQAFNVLGPRCRTLVTTRDAGILHTMGGPSVPVSLLTEEQALQLLADAVGAEPSALPPQALEVVKECEYLPLGVALCGGMVKKLSGDWTVVLERLRAADLERIADRQAIDERHRSIWRTMQVSVDVLPPDEQRRFAELAVFVRDNPVPEAAVATLWSHTGNLSDLDTTDLLINLAERSLIRLSQTTAKPGKAIDRRISLHDLLYDFATKLIGEPRMRHRTLLDAYRKRCPGGWPTGPDDGYFYQHLAHHLREAGRSADLSKLLFDYRWLRKKLEVTDANGLIADYDFAGDDSQARLVQGAIRLSSHTLAEDHSHLPSQLVGRLLSQKGSRVKALRTTVGTSEWSPWLRPLAASLTPPGGPLLRTLRGHEEWVRAVAVTPDGRYAVSGADDDTLKVWDLALGKAVHTLHDHEGGVLAAAVTGDARYAVSGSRGRTLTVWDLASGKVVHTLRGHEGEVWAAAVTGDGRFAVSASGDQTLKVWDLASGKAVHTLRGHENRVWAVAVTGDGRFAVSGSDDRTLKVWDLASGKAVHTLRGHEGSVRAAAVTGDGRFAVSGSDDQTLKVWDLATGKAVATLRGHESSVIAVAVTGDGRYAVSGSEDRTLKVWDLAPSKVVHTLRGHEDWVRGAAVTHDGRCAVSASGDQTLKVWDLASGKVVRTLRGHEGGVWAAAVTGDGRFAVSASGDQTLKVWDLASGKVVRTLRGHEGGVNAAAVTDDGRFAVSGSDDQTLRVWELASGKAVRILRGHEREVNAAAVTGDGRHAVSGSDEETLKVWDLASGKVVRTLRGHESAVWAVAVTRDGRYAVSGSEDRTLKVWELASGKAIHTLHGHEGWVWAVAVTGDGRYAVSGSEDQTLKVWDLLSGQVVASFCGDSVIHCCAVAPDGRTIVAGDKSGHVHFLRLENVK